MFSYGSVIKLVGGLIFGGIFIKIFHYLFVDPGLLSIIMFIIKHANGAEQTILNTLTG